MQTFKLVTSFVILASLIALATCSARYDDAPYTGTNGQSVEVQKGESSVFGLLLMVGGVVLIWWNEGRTARRSRSLKEAIQVVQKTNGMCQK